MLCLTDEILRARFDGELSLAEMQDAENHLSTCAGCRERSEMIAHQAADVRGMFCDLAPLPSETQTDAAFALSRFKARQLAGETHRPTLISRLFAARLRPVWGALAAACLILVLMSFAPARTWAQKFLAMLRVEKITVVPVDLQTLAGPNGDAAAGKMVAQMLSDNVVVTTHGEPQAVSTSDEASQRAGYKVRLLSQRADAPQLIVEGEQAFHMTVDRERMQGILSELGRPDLILPASLDGATIAVHVLPAVVAKYGHCRNGHHDGSQNTATGDGSNTSDCVVLVQVPSPTVSVPPDLNIAELAEAGLQVAGMSADQAHAFCQTVDWTSTLVIPIPRFVNSYQTVEVDGVEGTRIDLPRLGNRRPAGYSLVWVKNGVIYSLTGFGSSADAVPLAETLN